MIGFLVSALVVLGDVLPRSPIDGIVNGAAHNAQFIGNLLVSDPASRVSSSYFADEFGCQNSLLGFQLPSGLATFDNHVGDVVELRSEEQMGRVYAPRIVTPMKNIGAIGDWAMCQFPRNTMSKSRDTAFTSDATIAIAVTTAGPFPATVSLVDLGKKTNCDGHGRMVFVLAFPAAMLPVQCSGNGRGQPKRLVADRTIAKESGLFHGDLKQ